MRHILFLLLLFSPDLFSQQLKSVVYDFDGLDLGQTDLPEGDFSNYDLSYEVAADPLAVGGAIGDRVLKLEVDWSTGRGEFGRGITRYIQLDRSSDQFNFFFLNPFSNPGSVIAELCIREDDNQNGTYESAMDDKWTKEVAIPEGPGWQLISIPLQDLGDANTGGNSIFDVGYMNDDGRLLVLSITLKAAAGIPAGTYFIDMMCFSGGALPHGSSVTDRPPALPGAHCELGCLAYRTPADAVPAEVQSMLSGQNKLRYVNLFIPMAYSGTVANAVPGNSIQLLIDDSIRPIITWEMKFNSLPLLDGGQPRLNDIVSGAYDEYIDDFADKIKMYSDTVIIRPFHEFDGNWYPWSVSQNGNDTALFKDAYRYLVDRFDTRSVNNVLWMWCPNSNPLPNRAWNWIMGAYPGDDYVDVVATDVYNHAIAGVPDWRSFRYVMTETYFYLSHYLPGKPFFICELASRERYSSEPLSSQSKAEWICAMKEDLRSYFSATRAIVMFSTNKDHDWRINSSFAAQEAFRECIWEDPYFMGTGIPTSAGQYDPAGTELSPNPSTGEFHLVTKEMVELNITDLRGRVIEEFSPASVFHFGNRYTPGVYIVNLRSVNGTGSIKVLKQ